MQGQTDSPLTPKGIRMTERLALKLPTMDKIYVSPLGRTMHTAELLFGKRKFKKEDRLREIDLGEWEGRLQADLDVEEPEQHTNFWKNPDQFQVLSGPASRPPATYSGENFYDISKRSVECMQDLAAKHEGETIALVSHTTIIRAMLFHVEQRPLSEFWLPPAVYPASVSEVTFDGSAFEIKTFANIDHYDPADRPSGAY